MKLLSLSVLLLFSITFRAPDCVCIKDPHRSEEKIKADRRQAFDKATAVFEGKVVALNPYTVTFRLQKRWKGPSQNEIVLSTGAVPGYDGRLCRRSAFISSNCSARRTLSMPMAQSRN